jgi:intracellular sulfur oxidation DsrE/DsrF family protein
MSRNPSKSTAARRSFLRQLGGGTVIGAGLAANGLIGQAQSGPPAFRAARHNQDDWLDQVPGSHRFILDTTTVPGLENGMLYATNFMVANQQAYGLKDADLAVVIIMRHFSTVFGYNDAMWKKYGTALSQIISFTDPKTKQVPTSNVHLAATEGPELTPLAKRGVQFAVCQMATRVFAGRVAQATGGTSEAVYNELAANLIPNARLVPAGIVTLNRAQERGYALAAIG